MPEQHPDIDSHWNDCPDRRRPCAHCAPLDREQAIDDAWRMEPADDPLYAGPHFDM
ncbi:hypothetical protein [Streptomyces sp. Z26]|uniref:hypothetical protein n=1 Tax=Streptomyces sp. Z26 TaxID=2500177 RepID=UPI001404E729|nr:hypothetical protein [Streptomyces sp. Z26]